MKTVLEPKDDIADAIAQKVCILRAVVDVAGEVLRTDASNSKMAESLQLSFNDLEQTVNGIFYGRQWPYEVITQKDIDDIITQKAEKRSPEYSETIRRLKGEGKI